MTTGNPVFCTTWTYLGTPAAQLAADAWRGRDCRSGVQLVGRRDNDARLLRTARWLVKTLVRAVVAGRRKHARHRADGEDRRHDDGPDHRHHRHRLGRSAFLGFMVVWVKALPIIIIVVFVMGLLIYDFVQTMRAGESGA